MNRTKIIRTTFNMRVANMILRKLVSYGGLGERWSRGRAPDERTVVQTHLPPHICLCLSEETLKADGPFCLVSMPGEVKDPTQGVNV